MYLRIFALLTGAVLLIATLAGLYLAEEIIVWLNAIMHFLKVLWQKALALSAYEIWLFVIPFAKRFVFVEIPKKLAPSFLFVGVLSKATRYKIKGAVEQIKLWVVDKQEWMFGGLKRVFGERTSLVVSVVISLILFGVILFFFGSYLLVWVGSMSFLRPVGTLFRYIWSFIWGLAQSNMFRLLTFLGINQLLLFVFRYVPNDLKSRVRIRRFQLLRRVIRAKRLTRGKLQEIKESRIERMKLAWELLSEKIPTRNGRRKNEDVSP